MNVIADRQLELNIIISRYLLTSQRVSIAYDGAIKYMPLIVLEKHTRASSQLMDICWLRNELTLLLFIAKISPHSPSIDFRIILTRIFYLLRMRLHVGRILGQDLLGWPGQSSPSDSPFSIANDHVEFSEAH